MLIQINSSEEAKSNNDSLGTPFDPCRRLHSQTKTSSLMMMLMLMIAYRYSGAWMRDTVMHDVMIVLILWYMVKRAPIYRAGKASLLYYSSLAS
jgi:hypothetical protein